MKAIDYRTPWGRPSEHLLAIKREIAGHQLHTRRVKEARNRSTIDTDPPECVNMPHLIARLKKKKVGGRNVQQTSIHASRVTTVRVYVPVLEPLLRWGQGKPTFAFVVWCVDC